MNKSSIYFKLNDLEMDVVLATNFVKDLKKHQSVAHIQQKHVLKWIQMNPKENCYKYSAALAEASVYFMKTRVGFANEMARIAKYWFKSHDFKDISGASTFIELLAVYSTRKGRRGKRKYNPYLKAFIRFLEKLIKFENLNIAFNRCNAMFKDHPIGDSALPRVIDPVKPYNNFVRYWCENNDEIQMLKSSAASTLGRLQHLIVHPSVNEVDLIEFLFH